jgi:glycosyltransferase involved in cell wall biosynthesis/ubiquinone/menaquinone biosynthesis C-methylase UbiE
MRIAIVGPTHPIKGGVSQHTTVLAKQLAAAGHDVEIVSWAKQYPHFLYKGKQLVDEPEFAPFEPTRRVLAWNRPDSWVRAARSLRDRDIVVFAHITPVQIPPYRLMAALLRKHGPKIVVIAHNVLPHERSGIDRYLVSRLFNAADLVIAHSDSEVTLARSITDTRVEEAPLAPFMPDGWIARVPMPGEHRRLLFFGLVRPYKGLDVLLRAMTRAPSDIKLRVVGEFWSDPEETLALCRELGIADRVELRPGYIGADEVPDLFADVDALVLPYRTATGSQAVWTGFEFGVPVIATRAGVLAEHVREGVDGVLADPDDVDSLADALNRFYSPGVPEKMRADVIPINRGPLWARSLEVLLSVVNPPTDATSAERKPQLAYSELQALMLDEAHRRGKAKKIIGVLHHYLGRDDLSGLSALDVGCSAGFIADELAADGAQSLGADIDVPGLRAAEARFGKNVEFLCASGDALPLPDDSLDVVVFNHIYEHVVDPDAILTEIHRVLKPGGVAYLGLGNKHQIIEPHYRLPFLSWLPQGMADRYVRRFHRADEYYESYRTRSGLEQLVRGFHIWDYTIPVVRQPQVFHSTDQVKRGLDRMPVGVIKAAMPIIPTFIWIATKAGGPPRGAAADGVQHLDLTATPR